jgi:hypothetical protein
MSLSNPPQLNYESSCEGKVRYQSRRVARIARSQVHPDDHGHLRVYRCHFGAHYHLGHTWAGDSTLREDEPTVLDAAHAAARVLGVSIDEALELLDDEPKETTRHE